MKCKKCDARLRETKEQLYNRRQEYVVAYLWGYEQGFKDCREQYDTTKLVEVLMSFGDANRIKAVRAGVKPLKEERERYINAYEELKIENQQLSKEIKKLRRENNALKVNKKNNKKSKKTN
jgi:hypothetical protein